MTVGPVAHGGACVARVDDRVVFVRHALPGERVVVTITEGTEGDRFWRGDAVEVLVASEQRVVAPCRFSGPDGCGGCDFQHVALAHQRELKASVVAEQLRRIAGLDREVTVEAVAGDDEGLRWRTRQRYVDLPGGGRAMRKHRSHDLVEVDECLLEAAGGPSYNVAVPGRGTHDFQVAAGGFWQVHPGAPAALVGAVLDLAGAQAGERVLDLFAGVGLFARFLLDEVGPTGSVTAVEGAPEAARRAVRNLEGDVPVRVLTGDVAAVLAAEAPDPVDVVVLDPPREGARRDVVEQVVARQPRAVVHVACDPAALARDVSLFAEHDYRLVELRAFDLFPMTHHVECVALLTRP